MMMPWREREREKERERGRAIDAMMMVARVIARELRNLNTNSSLRVMYVDYWAPDQRALCSYIPVVFKQARREHGVTTKQAIANFLCYNDAIQYKIISDQTGMQLITE
jgi:hypothetical protein